MRVRTLRSSIVYAALSLSVIGGTACGSSNSSDATRQSSSGAPASSAVVAGTVSTAGSSAPDADGDSDRLGSRHDPDNDEVLTFGQMAGAVDRRALTGLVRHSYALAAAGDGSGACALLYSPTAESVAEELGSGSVSPSLHGNTCAQVASKLFAQRHNELVRQIASFEVSEVQVKGNRGFVRVRFAEPTEHLVAVHRERGIWKMNVLLDMVGV